MSWSSLTWRYHNYHDVIITLNDNDDDIDDDNDHGEDYDDDSYDDVMVVMMMSW